MKNGDTHLRYLQEQEWSFGHGSKTMESKWRWKNQTYDQVFTLCSVDTKWKTLTNTLSGLFCASLNFIDETMTTEPRLSFQSSQHDQKNEQLRYGSLPHENVCTENLTPWIKLLPCKAKVRCHIGK